RAYLNHAFSNRWIDRNGPILWPPRSPDLIFFLWSFIKNCVYARPATTKDDMKNRIRTVCYNISREVILRTIDSFKMRVNLCARREGDVFEHLLNS
ncbi:hypothetical protein X777_10301, partial [Ooceraea biroi]